ncbi:MAG TPA: LysE family translocator [Actinomycetota bacterium]|nr:LysE family translocator [Actinomycetota bacterium]
MPTDRLLTFAAAAFVLIVIPGPSVLFEISRAVALGRRAGLATVAGNAAGELVQAATVAVGIGAIVQRSAPLFTVLRVAGAAYIVVLGLRAIRDRRTLSQVFDATMVPRGVRRIFVEGFIVGATNPKSLVFFAAILPQFATASTGHLPIQLMVLSLVFVLIALISDSAWVFVAGTARNWFARSPRRLEMVGGAGGLMMLAVGVRLAFTGRKD